MRWSLLFVCGIVAVGTSTGTGCGRRDQPGRGVAGNVPYTVEVQTITPQPFRETVSATGTLRANESVELPAQRAGVVREIRFEEGRPVRRGDVLVALDDAELQAQQQRAEAQLELAAAQEQRSQRLLAAGTLTTQAQHEEARAKLDVARAELKLIRGQLEKTRIVAPFDGITGLRQVSVGAYLTPGMPVASLQDVSALKLDFTVPERYRELVRVGQTVQFRTAGQAEAATATITAIEPAIDPASRSLQVRAQTPNPEGRLMPGAFAEVQVGIDEIPQAILIPAIALIPGLKEQRVFVHRDGKVEGRAVRIGLRTATTVQIVEGLQPGEELIVTGIMQLRPGMRVQTKRAGA